MARVWGEVCLWHREMRQLKGNLWEVWRGKAPLNQRLLLCDLHPPTRLHGLLPFAPTPSRTCRKWGEGKASSRLTLSIFHHRPAAKGELEQREEGGRLTQTSCNKLCYSFEGPSNECFAYTRDHLKKRWDPRPLGGKAAGQGGDKDPAKLKDRQEDTVSVMYCTERWLQWMIMCCIFQNCFKK